MNYFANSSTFFTIYIKNSKSISITDETTELF